MRRRVASVVLLAGACSANARNGGTTADLTYTLYRTSTVNPDLRMHVATFDAAETEAYNRENCDVAQQLFNAQPGIKTRFFCEKGRFTK